MSEFIRALLWAAIQTCPDERWNALDKDMRQRAIMLLQPARY